ncbi:MAG: hypothetical protein O3A46_16125, partial [Candidatus Poribacteria bacterium]|nr:hypothetical protein [Candidatus Poribacteria bacterium]
MGESNGRHTIRYRVLNHDWKEPYREVEVHATRDEIRQLTDEGWLLREAMFQGEHLERLREAMDELEAEERDQHGGVGGSRRFGGLFLRHLMD